MSILTQYIGPGPTTREPTEDNREDDQQDIQLELEALHKDFLTQTDHLDRRQRHLEALDRAVSRCPITARLKINIQPQVLLKEDPEFQNEWNRAKVECELKLINVIRKHLRTRVIGKSQENLQQMGKETFKVYKVDI